MVNDGYYKDIRTCGFGRPPCTLVSLSGANAAVSVLCITVCTATVALARPILEIAFDLFGMADDTDELCPFAPRLGRSKVHPVEVGHS